MSKKIIANWKMNLTREDIRNWFQEFEKYYPQINFDQKSVILSPTYIHLEETANLILKLGLSNIKLAAQGVSKEREGAFTSQVSAKQLKDYCEYVIVGHSETQASVSDKIQMSILCKELGLKPIICFTNLVEVPETLKGYQDIAWEDPTNISKNGVYNPKNPNDISKTLKQFNMHVIYGGSVNQNNIKDLAKNSKLSGYLIGNASLNPKTFYEIIQSC